MSLSVSQSYILESGWLLASPSLVCLASKLAVLLLNVLAGSSRKVSKCVL